MSDNIVVMQELIHFMSIKNVRKGGMVIKIDLEKAFDRVEWSFIKVILEHFHFPLPLIKIVMACISSSSISIPLNGGMLKSFRPSRALRPGDPFSPYIFILCMEFLGLLMNESCQDGDWKPLKSSRSGPSFFHYSSPMTLFSLLRPPHLLLEPLKKFWKSPAIPLAKKLALLNPRWFFPIMWIPLSIGISTSYSTLGNPRKLENT